MISPDVAANGLLAGPVDPLRYGSREQPIDPHEADGIIYAFMPSRSRILDVGCAAGAMTLAVNRGKSNRVLGVEPDATRAALARANGIEVVEGYVDYALVSQHGPFDAVVFADVLEHCTNPTDLLRIGIAALRPGGVLIISVPNVAHWSVRQRLLRGRWEYASYGIMDATHLRWFTHASLQRLLEGQGLKVVHMQASAGKWMTEYNTLRSIPCFGRLIDWASARFPRLFGCQIVVAAKVA